MTDVELALPAQATQGRGPAWDAVGRTLVWVDAAGAAVHRYWPATGGDEVITLPQPAGAARPRGNGGLVVNLRDGVGLREPDGTLRWLVYWEREGFHADEAAVDPAGRLWAGSTRPDAAGGGWLARVDPDGRAKVVLDDVRAATGIGWSPDGDRMYWVDAPACRIDVFDFDLAEGTPTGRRALAQIDGGVPGGLCVDADGCVWIAVTGAGQVRRYTPDGTLDRTLHLPVRAVTACAFGGDALTDLYITTNGTTPTPHTPNSRTPDPQPPDPQAGALLVIPNAAPGHLPPHFPG